MQRIAARVAVIVCSCAAAFRAFDFAYAAFRLAPKAVPADSLIHYNVILWWWRQGASPRGFTLTPSPYFIDLLIQLPLALIAPDFERFSYLLALVFAALLFVSIYALARIVFDRLAIIVAGGAICVFYAAPPWSFIAHAFMYNHTSEVFSSLGLVALLFALFRPDAKRRAYAPIVYALAVAACTLSSPFFIATYCVPVTLALIAILGTPLLDRRRFAWFLGLTGAGAFAGLVGLSLIARYVWPVRGDTYPLTPAVSFARFTHTLATEPGLLPIAIATVIAAIAAGALSVLARRRGARPVEIFLLALVPASLLACVLMPLKRGALDSPYEMRYLTMPWLLAAAFYVAVAVHFARRVALPRWAAVVPGAAAIALVATMHGCFTMYGSESTTGATLSCLRRADKYAGLADGLAAVWIARYLNAARHASGWHSPNVVIEVYPSNPLVVDPREGNIDWLNGTYPRTLNFLATHGLSDDAKNSLAGEIGPPDRVLTCPSPIDMRDDGKSSFELWIWDKPEAQRKLADKITHDNLRSPFAPRIGATTMAIDLAWGMFTDAKYGGLVGGKRVWHRETNQAGGSMAYVRPMWLPSGHYRIDLELAAAETGPVAELVVHQDRKAEPIGRYPLAAGHASVELDIDNFGGPTSGDLTWFDVMPGAVAALELSAFSITLVDQKGINPFQIFR